MNEVATTTPKPAKELTLRQEIDSDYFKKQIAVALPKHMTPDRFARVALTAMLKTPKLLECTKESVIECLLNCSALGIEPDGRRAHLIPYGNKCTLIVDYKGIVELAKRSGDVSNVFAQIICDKDDFVWENGEVTHRIDWRHARGDMYAVYATITLKDGSKQSEVMTKDEVEAIRKRSKAGTSGPWVTDFNEMAKKTVFRRLSKWITLSPEVADALDKDEEFSSLRMDPELNQAKPNFTPAPVVTSDPAGDGDLGPQPEKRKGRPPGSKNQPTTTNVEAQVTPAAQPEPPANQSSPTPVPEAARQVNYVKGIRGMLQIENISEADLLEFGRATKQWDDSLASLEEVAMTSPSKLQQAYEEWPSFAKAIKAIVK